MRRGRWPPPVKSCARAWQPHTADRLGIGIGIATGEAFVGNVGGGEVADYTVIGDTVNVAARLQGEAASGEILISQETYARVVTEYPFAKRHELLLKGKSEPVIAWEIQPRRFAWRLAADDIARQIPLYTKSF